MFLAKIHEHSCQELTKNLTRPYQDLAQEYTLKILARSWKIVYKILNNHTCILINPLICEPEK